LDEIDVMPSGLKRFFGSKPVDEGKLASQPPGIPFPWPRSTRLVVLEDTVLAIPAAVLAKDEKIGDMIHSDRDAEIRLPTSPDETLIHLRLKAGMSVWLSKSVQGVVVAADKRPRAIKVIAAKDCASLSVERRRRCAMPIWMVRLPISRRQSN
jgi:hypothetical protein